MTSNYPPGVNWNSIPGSRPDDILWEKAVEDLDVVDMCYSYQDRCDFAEFDDDNEVFCACMKNIVLATDEAIIVYDGDPMECPFAEGVVEQIFEGLKENLDPPDFDR